MGITTFSGPVRSDNGFQEWNGSEWVPVAGGGGGGDVISVVSIPLNNTGTTSSVTLPTPTQLGQTYFVTLTFDGIPNLVPAVEAELIIEPVVPGRVVVFGGLLIQPNTDTETFFEGPDTSLTFSSSLFGTPLWYMQITYNGYINTGGGPEGDVLVDYFIGNIYLITGGS